MFQPGMEWRLARIRHAEIIEEAALERASRKQDTRRPAGRPARLLAAAAAFAPLALALLMVLRVLAG